jgi:hypothetical protein
MNARSFRSFRSFIKGLGTAAALCCLAPGCGPGLVPPSPAKVANGGFAGAFGSADASTNRDNPGGPTTGGANGSGLLPTAGGAGRAGQGAAPPPTEADAGSEDAGAEP